MWRQLVLDHWRHVYTSMLADALVKPLVQYGHATASINLHMHVNMLIAFLKRDRTHNTHAHMQTYKHLARFDAGLVTSH